MKLTKQQIRRLRPLAPLLREVLDHGTFEGRPMAWSDRCSCKTIARLYFEGAR
jgi:hypothetical protein